MLFVFPTFWMAMLAWTGASVGGGIGNAVKGGAQDAGNAGKKGGEAAQSAVKKGKI